jgi:hypothetical protein
VDTDALLSDILRYAEEYQREQFVEAARDLADSVQLLHLALSGGYELPSAWRVGRDGG